MLNGQPPEGKLVNIHITRGGFHRVISALAQANGTFDLTFRPLPSEAGVYTIGAAHPGQSEAPAQGQFTLFGREIRHARAKRWSLIESITVNGDKLLNNLGDAPLTGLIVAAMNVPSNLVVTPSLQTNALSANGSVPVRYATPPTARRRRSRISRCASPAAKASQRTCLSACW